jgi:2-(1,2-epoxy-1,2-dihydrophenyl)acetyl-CoA isomerase
VGGTEVTSWETIDYELSDDVSRIYLNRPHSLNAVIPQLVEDLSEALEQVLLDRARAVLLSGRGRAFCAGQDLKQINEAVLGMEARAYLSTMQDVCRRMRSLPCAVIGAVRGYALGIGFEFALSTDMIVAAEDAQFGFPEVEVGLSLTGGATRQLPLTVGPARARELVLLGRRISAEEAKDLGLVNRVVATDKLEDEALSLALNLRDRPPLALVLARKALELGPGSDIETTYELEISHAMATLASEESSRAAEEFSRRKSTSGEGTGGQQGS